jgi:hypothetical protein
MYGESSKKCRQFLKNLLKFDFSADELANLVGHLCWNNLTLSRRVAKFLIEGINSNN